MTWHNKNAIFNHGISDNENPNVYLRLKQVEKPSGVGVLDDELSDPAARAAFRIRVKYLGVTPRAQWNIKQFRSLKQNLYEIKWKSGAVQWRAFGYDEPSGYFVVVKVCTKKEPNYSPANCIDTARATKAAAESGKQKVINYVL